MFHISAMALLMKIDICKSWHIGIPLLRCSLDFFSRMKRAKEQASKGTPAQEAP
jgi:hypothetical protein